MSWLIVSRIKKRERKLDMKETGEREKGNRVTRENAKRRMRFKQR